jgi:hypothetical protein
MNAVPGAALHILRDQTTTYFGAAAHGSHAATHGGHFDLRRRRSPRFRGGSSGVSKEFRGRSAGLVLAAALVAYASHVPRRAGTYASAEIHPSGSTIGLLRSGPSDAASQLRAKGRALAAAGLATGGRLSTVVVAVPGDGWLLSEGASDVGLDSYVTTCVASTLGEALPSLTDRVGSIRDAAREAIAGTPERTAQVRAETVLSLTRSAPSVPRWLLQTRSGDPSNPSYLEVPHASPPSALVALPATTVFSELRFHSGAAVIADLAHNRLWGQSDYPQREARVAWLAADLRNGLLAILLERSDDLLGEDADGGDTTALQALLRLLAPKASRIVVELASRETRSWSDLVAKLCRDLGLTPLRMAIAAIGSVSE